MDNQEKTLLVLSLVTRHACWYIRQNGSVGCFSAAEFIYRKQFSWYWDTEWTSTSKWLQKCVRHKFSIDLCMHYERLNRGAFLWQQTIKDLSHGNMGIYGVRDKLLNIPAAAEPLHELSKTVIILSYREVAWYGLRVSACVWVRVSARLTSVSNNRTIFVAKCEDHPTQTKCDSKNINNKNLG